MKQIRNLSANGRGAFGWRFTSTLKQTMHMKRLVSTLGIAALGLGGWIATPAARADTFTWNVPLGNWTNAANWIGGVPFDSGVWDVATIANNGTAVVTTATAAFEETQVGNNGVVGNLIITNGGTLSVNNWLVVSRNDAAGNTPLSTLIVSGTGVLNKTGDGFLLGDSANCKGQMTVKDNAFVHVTGGWNGIGNGTGEGWLTLQDNAVYTLDAQDWNIGDYGSGARGHAYIKDNATLNCSRFFVGKNDNAVGALWQSGGAIVGTGGNANEWTFGGDGSGSVNAFGFYNLSAGTFSNPYNFQIGRYGKGLIYQTGGTVTALGWTSFGRFGGSVGVMWLTGGSFNHTGAGTHLFIAENGRGEFTLGGAGVLDCNLSLRLGNPGGLGILNLNSGTAAVPSIEQTGGTGYLNFNGATVKAKASSTTFLTGLAEACVFSGNAIFDTAGADVTVAQALVAPYGNGVKTIPVATGGAGYMAPPIVQIDASGVGSGATAVAQIDPAAGTVTNIVVTGSGYGYSGAPNVTLIGGGSSTAATLGAATLDAVTPGGLVKKGAGTLTLTGNNTYAGSTVVNEGLLVLAPNSFLNGPFSVANGAGFGVVMPYAGSQLVIPSLALGTSAGTTLSFDLGSFGNPFSAPLSLTGNLAVNGTVTVNIADGLPQVGQFPLVNYGSRSGSGSFALGTLPIGVVATLVDDTANKLIYLKITAVSLPRWEGLAGGNWDIGLTTNWVELSTGLPAYFAQGNAVLFDDAALGTTNVNLVATVTPAKVTVTNSVLNYTVSGSGKISGAATLTKQGVGSLALNTLNDYTGVTRIEGGTVSVTTLVNYGSASSIGKSNLVFAGGTLSYAGPAATINRGYTVAGGGALDLQNNLTLGGRLTATSGNFTKTGSGTLTYAAATTDNQLSVGGGGGAYVVSSGSVVLDGTGGQTNNIVGETWIGQGAGSTGRVDLVKGAWLNTDIWTVIGRQGGNGTMVVTNSTLSHNINNDLIVGADIGSVGRLDVVGNSKIYNNAGWYLIGVGGATGIYNQSGGLYTNSQGYTRFYVGRDTGGVGTANLSGTAVVSAGNDLHVGVQNATGTMTLSNSAAFSQQNGWTFIGGNYDATTPTSAGTLTLADSATLTLPGRIHIGFKQGNGTLNVVGGTLTKNGGEAFMIGEDSGVGIMNHSAGTVTCPTCEFWVGDFNATGTYNLSGTGVLNVNNNWLAIGRNNATGVMNMTGGTVNKLGGGNFSVGSYGGNAHQGTLNISGGLINIQSGQLIVGEVDNITTGTANVSGTAEIRAPSVRVGSDNGTTPTGNLNLNGGTLKTGQIYGGSGTANVNLNGATIVATANQPAFLTNLTVCNLQTGGLTINDGGFSIGIPQAVLSDPAGDGGLTKLGNGTLALNGINTYTNKTLVSAGTLGGNGTIAGPVTVGAGATLAPGLSVGTLTINNTLTLSAGSTTVMEIDQTAGTNDQVVGVTTLNYGGTLVLRNLSGALTVGKAFKLFTAGTYLNSFASLVSETAGQTVTWDTTKLGVDGTVKVLTAVPTPVKINTTVGGGSLTVSWPVAQTGWLLQAQTNALTVGISTNWVSVPGSTSTNQMSFPIDTTKGAAFFRLVFP